MEKTREKEFPNKIFFHWLIHLLFFDFSNYYQQRNPVASTAREENPIQFHVMNVAASLSSNQHRHIIVGILESNFLKLFIFRHKHTMLKSQVKAIKNHTLCTSNSELKLCKFFELLPRIKMLTAFDSVNYSCESQNIHTCLKNIHNFLYISIQITKVLSLIDWDISEIWGNIKYIACKNGLLNSWKLLNGR